MIDNIIFLLPNIRQSISRIMANKGNSKELYHKTLINIFLEGENVVWIMRALTNF